MTARCPTPERFRLGVLAYRKFEGRDAMYRVASFLADHFSDRPRQLADGIGVLLLTWNQALYRYGAPDLGQFESFLTVNSELLRAFRTRTLSTISTADSEAVSVLFIAALEALAVRKSGARTRRSPVAVAKALHLLAPGFFPLWDEAIAKAYGCYYLRGPVPQYLRFMSLSRGLVEKLQATIDLLLDGKPRLKVLDEYNYARYTKGWV